MRCKILQTAVTIFFLGFYAIGAMFVCWVAYHFGYGDPIYKIPNREEQMVKCLVDAFRGYTIAFTIWCQTGTFSYRSKQPLISALSLIISFGMIIALVALLICSTKHLWTLVSFCLIGVAFAELFLITASDLQFTCAFLRQQKDNWMMIIEEKVRKTLGFTSHIEEAVEKEDII